MENQQQQLTFESANENDTKFYFRLYSDYISCAYKERSLDRSIEF